MKIVVDDLSHPKVHALLAEHLRGMHDESPPESVHALDIEGLRRPELTFWCVWENDELLGCGALKALSPEHGEIKSMRTASAHLRKGVAAALLEHIIDEARTRNYTQVSLETGSTSGFFPALALYRRFGFSECGPFSDYELDPFSIFMTMKL